MAVARGFTFAGVHAGIKPFKKDLALIVSERPCAAAAALTINAAKAAPVVDCQRRLPAAQVRAILVNSGNANALTGPEGQSDVTELCSAVGRVLEVDGAAVLMASTGVIGQRLPKAKIIDALPKLKAQLKGGPESAAEAILTTDTHIKVASRSVKLGRKDGRLTAICKGSGMIAPQLASTIAVICTDVAITPVLLQRALLESMDGSFNNLTIDNDMSTNDAVLALANGVSGNPEITDEGSPEYELFVGQLRSLCVELAKEVAKDGEGATKLLEVTVEGAPSKAVATDLAKAVAGSTLVKAAVFGADPNWGRILATVGARVGSQRYPVDPTAAKVTVQGMVVYDQKPVLEAAAAVASSQTSQNDANEGPSGHARLRSRMRAPEVTVVVDLRSGPAAATAWGCDLSYDYVKINADYSSLLVQTADGSVAKDDRLTNYSPKFKVNLVTQALSYISRFAGKRVVLKLGRQAMSKDSLRASIAEDVNLLRAVGMVPIIVHGESPEGSSKGDANSREMVLNGQTNTELVTLLNRTGTQAIGISGLDASFLKAKRAGDERGEVTEINRDLLDMFLQRNYVPVVSPVGFLDDGTTLALEPDQVASEIAAASQASKLVYLVGVPGFVQEDTLLAQLTTTSLREKLEAGAFNRNLTRKGRCAISALERGVERVHVIDARTPHSIIAEFFTDQGIGSLVTHG